MEMEGKKLSSFAEYLKYRNLPSEWNNPKASKKGKETKEFIYE